MASGLSILPGPAMVPIWGMVAGKLQPKLGPTKMVIAGSAAFAAGLVWWAAAMTVKPDYAIGMLGGIALTGVGVGLVTPILTGVAVSSLPPQRFATGSGVVNMTRQLGLTIGVAVLIAVIGTSHTGAAQLSAFRHAWIVTAAIAVATALPVLLLQRQKPPAPAPVAPAADEGVVVEAR
jgi:MFS family permease